MSNEQSAIDPELTAIEAALGSLVPAQSRIDRDLVMFRAGHAAACSPSRGGRGWIACAACLLLIALGEGVLLAHRPEPRVVERVVVVREPVGPPVEAPATIAGADTPPTSGWRSSATELALGRTPYERLAE